MSLRTLAAIVARIASEFPRRTIGNSDGDTYLERYRIWSSERFQVFLHRFARSDEAAELHSHPWAWAASLILAGGYWEDRLGADGAVWRREVRPGRLNFLRAQTFHRVDLRGHECWSLFVTGPRSAGWGFLDVATRSFTPWREYFAKRGIPDPRPKGEAA